MTLVGLTLQDRDDLLGALEAHKKAVALHPKLSQAWINKGIVHRQLNEPDEAEKCYRTGIELNPGNADGWASLGALHIVRKEYAKAIEVLEKAVKLEADNAIAHSNLAIAYARVRRFDDAEKELKKAVAAGYKNEAGARRMIDEAKAAPSNHSPD
ncbi:MAG: tetratricopeptide repeat protein [Polyangiaceae bacterium]|nr:tetratricopeptide repeat protein [Polyangiaceae bacterium]